MTQQEKIDHVKQKLYELERFCIDNRMDCKLMFCGGVGWTSQIYLAKNMETSVMALTPENISRSWSGVLFEITFKDSDKDDNIESMQNMVGYLIDELKR